MPKYQLLTCNVALAGDLGNIVARGDWNPVTYPELIVLEFMHGETSVTDVFECGYTEEREPRQEKERLMVIYGKGLADQLFPGHAIQLPAMNERYKPRLVGTLINPGPPAPVNPEPPVVEIDPAIAGGASSRPVTSQASANRSR